MPAVSQSRYSTASSTTLSSAAYRPSSSTSMDKPYYSSVTGSYMVPRSSSRSTTYSDRTTTSYASEYRSHRLTYDSDGVRDRKSSYSTDYSRHSRAPSISDSDSSVTGTSKYAVRTDRTSPRSRDTSVSRSDSARSSRSDPLPRSYLGSTTTDFYNKYSPSNYVPLTQRISAAVTGDTARQRTAVDTSTRPPRRARLPETEVKTTRIHPPAPHTNPEKRLATNVSNSTVAKPCAVIPPACATNTIQRVPELTEAANNSEPARLKRDIECTQRQRNNRTTSDYGLPKTRTSTYIPKAKLSSTFDKKAHLHNGLRSDSLPIADDNGNDLPLTVNEIRRRFDTKMTVTKLPARDPTLLYKTAHSSDNIYGQLRNLNSSVSSLTDEKPVPVHKPISSDKSMNGTGSLKWEFSGRDSKKTNDTGYTIKQTTEPGSDISTIYIAGKNNIDSIPLNSVKSQLNANNVISKILEKSTTIYVGNGDKIANDDKYKKSDSAKNVLSIEIGSEQNGLDAGPSSKTSNESRSKHTSDFASYIQVSAPAAATSPLNSVQKRFMSSNCNGDESNHEPIKNGINLQSTDDDDGTNLRYIDSEPSLESDNKLFMDYNGKDDGSYEEEGFENKTFEHANGHLLRKGADEVDYSSKIKLNGFSKLTDDVSDVEGDVYTVKKSKDDDRNSNSRYIRADSDSSAPETPLSKRKFADTNGESSTYQLYQNDSSVSLKSSSPVNASSTNSLLNNSNNSSPCGSLTTSRRRSVDSKSPQPGSGEQFNKSSGLNGLRNIGNTCFMNSVVQCLSNTKPLLEYCGTPDAFAPHINTTLSCMKGALIKAFSTVITELWKADETDGVVNTTSLKTQIQRFAPRFMGYSQQDAQEFLRYLLEGLHEDVNRVTVKPKPILTEIDDNLSDAQKAEESWQRYLRSEDSRVGDIFVGQLKSSLRCTHCSHTSVTFDPFWDLSLPIPSRTGQLKLTQCLSHFTKEEELDGDEKPTCGKCQVRRKCLKWFTVQKFPRVLVLHLKRFSPTERFRGKLNVPVEFPLMGLDMTPFAAVASPGTRGPQPGSAMYNLYAVSNHSGTTYSGHYTAYCKHPYNGEWHEYNDSRVSPILPKNVVSSEAYVLFYELSSGSVPS